MTAYVRVRKLEDLRSHIDSTGTQADVAAASGLSTTRLNQICVGKHKRLSVDKAVRLEQTLGVPLGTLFVADEPLPAPYLDTDDSDGNEPESEPDDPAALACSAA